MASPEFLAAALKTGWLSSFSQSCWVALWAPRKESCLQTPAQDWERPAHVGPRGLQRSEPGTQEAPARPRGHAERRRGKQEGEEASWASSALTQYPLPRAALPQSPSCRPSGASPGEGWGWSPAGPAATRKQLSCSSEVTFSGLVPSRLWHYRSPACGPSPALLCLLHLGLVPVYSFLIPYGAYHLLAPTVEGPHGCLLSGVPPVPRAVLAPRRYPGLPAWPEWS